MVNLVSRDGDWLTSLAPAKVNLFLHITGRRPDGYHELESLFVFCDFGDVVRVREAAGFSFSVAGPFAESLRDTAHEDNLVLRAATLLAASTGSPGGAEIILEKNLPVAAGIGGGSSDAAATLRALTALWELDTEEAQLQSLALKLGADVPSCLNTQPKLVRGIGDRMEVYRQVPPLFIVLANPGLPLSTPDVFGTYKKQRSGFSPILPTNPAWDQVLALGNDLIDAAFLLRPEIRDLLAKMRQCEGLISAGMSGSGGTCYALFDVENAAEACADRLSSHAKSDLSADWVQLGQVFRQK